jgi:SsrA-binding protein
MTTLADNARARYDYNVLETFEAGLALTGPEVKAAKNGQISIKGCFVTQRGGELWLLNSHISAYGPAATQQKNYDPTRTRKLLMHRKQIDYLTGKISADGLTIVPLRVYTNHRLIKVEIALASGKKKHDKRASIKKREQQREVQSALRRRR